MSSDHGSIDRGFGYITLNPSARLRRLRERPPEVTGDGSGPRCPPLPQSAYAPGAMPLTDDQLDQLKAEWERQRHGKLRLLTPLPRRVRLRLAATHAVDRTAIWLVDHKQFRAAVALWRAFGMWRR